MRFLKVSVLMAFMLFCAVMLPGVLSLRAVSPRGGAVPGATINGDVNCDGQVNIADAVSIIQWQFKGGEAPCALAQEAGILDKLNALGDQITALQGSVATLAPTWPPRAENVVSVARMEGNNNTESVAYEVPDGKTFVLTNLTIAGANGGNFEIFEISGGKKTSKWQRVQGPFVSAIGLRFDSGSQVVFFLNDPSHGCSPMPCRDPVTYSFAGYLIDS